MNDILAKQPFLKLRLLVVVAIMVFMFVPSTFGCKVESVTLYTGTTATDAEAMTIEKVAVVESTTVYFYAKATIAEGDNPDNLGIKWEFNYDNDAGWETAITTTYDSGGNYLKAPATGATSDDYDTIAHKKPEVRCSLVDSSNNAVGDVVNDECDVYVVAVDIEMQSLAEEVDDNGDPVSPPHEMDPGAFLVLNNLDLEPAVLKIEPTDLDVGTIVLTPTSDDGAVIKVFLSSDKSDGEKYSWDLSTESLPASVWVEGTAAGSANLKMTYKYDNDGDDIPEDICDDTVKVTVVFVNLEVGGLDEMEEDDPGLVVELMSELTELSLDYTTTLTVGTLTLDIKNSDDIEIYDDLNVLLDSSTTQKTWDLGSSQSPPEYLDLWTISPSSALKDNEIMFSWTYGTLSISDKAYITVTGAKFIEDTSQKYGFDGFSTDVSTYKSLKAADQDTDTVSLISFPANTELYLVPDDPSVATVSPEYVASSPATLTLTSQSDVEGEETMGIHARVTSTTGESVANLQVQLFDQPANKKIRIHTVNNSGDDHQDIEVNAMGSSSSDVCVSAGSDEILDTMKQGDDDIFGNTITVGENLKCESTANNQKVYVVADSIPGLQSHLNNTVFNQAVAGCFSEVKVDIGSQDCAYDENGNGMLDMNLNNEWAKILEQLSDSDYHYNIFVVIDIESGEDYDVAGFAIPTQKAAFVVHSSNDRHTNYNYLLAHELGHSFGGLADLDLHCDTSTDPENLMSHCNTGSGDKLRYNQWETIRTYVD